MDALATTEHNTGDDKRQVGVPYWVYEKVVGKKAANVRRDPLQRVRDDGVLTGG